MRRRIYSLTGLPPEVVAVAFAKCSRSPDAFDVIAADLNADKSRKFHEKWIVGYGHSSVAEHAVLSIALENVSILATKVIEDNRLASYTEKSTRYQVFDRDTYYKPKKLLDSDFGELYVKTLNHIMDYYNQIVCKMKEFFTNNYPQEPDVSDALYRVRIKNMALDSCRYLLPVSTLTNLGMTANARVIEHAIIKLLTHPLDEMKEIGKDMKKAALEITPTLVKYTEFNEYMAKTSEDIKEYTKAMSPELMHIGADVELVEFDRDADIKVIAAILYRYSDTAYEDIVEKVRVMSFGEREKILDKALCRMSRFDRPLRELEHTYYTFDIMMDYGAFRDIQRHRIVTQTNQDCTVKHGYCTPTAIVDAGLKKGYDKCMNMASDAFQKIAEKYPHEAQYIIPMGYNKRVLFKCNLRELFHLIPLRTGKTSHFSYKKIAQQMYQLVKEIHPMLVKYMQCSS